MTDTSPPPKLALLALPERYSLPGRPGSAPASVVDCHRQTGFVLAAELDAFAELMGLHLDAVSSPGKPRTPADAATLTYTSRTYALLADTCRLMTYGSYSSCLPLIRSALDCIATRRALAGADAADYEQWFTDAVSREGAATAIDLGRFHASSPLIADPVLDRLYRVISDLAMPHFGSTLLLSAPEADSVKVSISFADPSFHLGWAELISGWLLDLAVVSLTLVTVENEALQSKVESAVKTAQESMTSRPRCHIEEADGRWVIQNYRRNNRGQPKRVILG